MKEEKSLKILLFLFSSLSKPYSTSHDFSFFFLNFSGFLLSSSFFYFGFLFLGFSFFASNVEGEKNGVPSSPCHGSWYRFAWQSPLPVNRTSKKVERKEKKFFVVDLFTPDILAASNYLFYSSFHSLVSQPCLGWPLRPLSLSWTRSSSTFQPSPAFHHHHGEEGRWKAWDTSQEK